MSQLIRNHLLGTTCVLAAGGSILALRPLPSSIPLIALLVLLRISTEYIVPRPHYLLHLLYLWISITIGCIISFASAGSAAVASVTPTLAYSATFSLLALIPFFIAAKFRLRGFFFPAVWSTCWGLVTAESPIGRLGVWAPLSGDSAYAWTRPYLGELGIDWAVGGCTEVLACFVAWHLMGKPNSSDDEQMVEEPLIAPTEGSPLLPQRKAPKQKTSYKITILALTLVGLSIPSNFIDTLPSPLHDDNNHQIGVACALPHPSNEIPPFDLFMRETMTLTNRAHIVLWPEGAVSFDSAEDRRIKLDKVQASAATNGATIGVSFTDPVPGDDRPGAKRRNGIAVVNRNGVVLEYYKRHLVPLVESFPQKPGKEPSPIANITEGSSKKPGRQWQLTLAANICLDFAHPIHDLQSKPTLILGPARTWQTNVGQVMMEMARHRAEELGTRVLWCDGGEGGLSGVVGMGESGVQVGYGSWIKEISVPSPLDEKRTLFGRHAGEVWGVLGAWVPFIITFFGRRKVGQLSSTRGWLLGAKARVLHLLRRQPHEQNLIDV